MCIQMVLTLDKWQVNLREMVVVVCPMSESRICCIIVCVRHLISQWAIELIRNISSTDVPDIGLAVRVFANGPGDLGSIPGRVIPKTQKMVLDASLLNTQHYKVRIKGKVGQSREGVAPFPTPWCSSYRKGSLRVTLDYGRQLYLYWKW